MSLQSAIEALTGVAEEARALREALLRLATLSGDATETQKGKVEKLAKRLDTASREAARERRRAEIAELTRLIDAGDVALSVTGLSSRARSAIEAELIRMKGRRTRLRNQEATDFGGILTKPEVDKIVELTQKAMAEVRQKKLAASFLDTVFRIGDLALTLAGKLAL